MREYYHKAKYKCCRLTLNVIYSNVLSLSFLQSTHYHSDRYQLLMYCRGKIICQLHLDTQVKSSSLLFQCDNRTPLQEYNRHT